MGLFIGFCFAMIGCFVYFYWNNPKHLKPLPLTIYSTQYGKVTVIWYKNTNDRYPFSAN